MELKLSFRKESGGQIIESSTALLPLGMAEKFIRISYQGKKEIFEVKNRHLPDRSVVVSSPNFKDVADNTVVDVEECGNVTVLFDDLKKSKSSKVAFWGLLIAVSGLIIDACLDLGEKGEVLFDTSANTLIAARYISWILKISGLLLIALKGLFTGEKIQL